MSLPQSSRHRSSRDRRVAAVLGPTNTGKTHFAIERMVAHRSGIIGLPLRLLAREVYEKVVRLKGAAAVALVTGEEKIVPPEASYFVCTVEAMPLGLDAAFVAIDEIQLCADPERGHVFTDRLLFVRGREETLFLGSETMRPMIRRFVPEAEFIVRPRFSDLAYAGARKLTRLPRRSAIVAFSAEDVYGIADLVRRQRGGAAVVLGALSPRTRNAQVALYQSGEVDFLVATDAIGMGVNMDVDHVAFAALEKFDGVGLRSLRADEAGQIAGRAGRHMNDGTFGVTGECEPLDAELVERIESHRYEPVRLLQYRNSALDFHSVAGLIASLERPPPEHGLVKTRQATDHASLRALGAQDDIAALAQGTAAIRRLWDACQIPDFLKLSLDEHVRLVRRIYQHLMSDAGVLPTDWFARQLARLDATEGDVASLSQRLAQIRTWAYAAHRPGWLDDPAHWQEQARAIEDRLSDALHERLTQRFIDRRSSVLMRRLAGDAALIPALDESGGVSLGGQYVGKLSGFRFENHVTFETTRDRSFRAASVRALQGEFVARARRLRTAEDIAITLSEHGRLWWDGAAIAHLEAGATPLEPRVKILADDELDGATRESVESRLALWMRNHCEERLAPLLRLLRAVEAKPGTRGALPSDARGVAWQLCESLGSMDRHSATLPADEMKAKRLLSSFGVIFGRHAIYLPRLLKPDAASLLALLWAVYRRLERIPAPPPRSVTAFEPAADTPAGFLAASGFRMVGPRAVRIDMIERLSEALLGAAGSGSTAESLERHLCSLLGSGSDALAEVLAAMGWSRLVVGNESDVAATVWRQVPSRGKRLRPPRPMAARAGSPFGTLATLVTESP
jgi:ATP-dependent RNA helicase SUPV3L1/SUV3